MITASTWVPRGYAAAFPTKYVFDEEEYARISKLAKLELDDAKEGLEEAKAELNGTKKKHQEDEGGVVPDEAKEEEEKEDIDGDGDVLVSFLKCLRYMR
jgi:periodic tryptophan protein 1